jgi:hypothetical protein
MQVRAGTGAAAISHGRTATLTTIISSLVDMGDKFRLPPYRRCGDAEDCTCWIVGRSYDKQLLY